MQIKNKLGTDVEKYFFIQGTMKWQKGQSSVNKAGC